MPAYRGAGPAVAGAFPVIDTLARSLGQGRGRHGLHMAGSRHRDVVEDSMYPGHLRRSRIGCVGVIDDQCEAPGARGEKLMARVSGATASLPPGTPMANQPSATVSSGRKNVTFSKRTIEARHHRRPVLQIYAAHQSIAPGFSPGADQGIGGPFAVKRCASCDVYRMQVFAAADTEGACRPEGRKSRTAR